MCWFQEQLHATIEQAGASNEELRCTTEEPGGSKEELQSINEELITVNRLVALMMAAVPTVLKRTLVSLPRWFVEDGPREP